MYFGRIVKERISDRKRRSRENTGLKPNLHNTKAPDRDREFQANVFSLCALRNGIRREEIGAVKVLAR